MFRKILIFLSISSIKTRMRNHNISTLALFDKKSKLSSFCKINRFTILRNSIIGDYSYIGQNSHLINTRIGKFCSISKNVNIGVPKHPTNIISTNPIFYSKKNGTGYCWVNQDYYDDLPPKTIIGNDVWIGMNSTILGGLIIGDGAIIGAHSLVTKDVDAYSIVGGVPAKIIKYRFDSIVINELEKLKWWEHPEKLIRKNLKYFNIDVDLKHLEELKDSFKS